MSTFETTRLTFDSQNMTRLQTLSGSQIPSNALSSNFVATSLPVDSTQQITRDLFSTATFLGSTGNSARNNTYLSEIEQAILKSNEPITINSSEEIQVLGERGLWANKQEVVNWRGEIPLTQYQINEDQNPEVITKRSRQDLEYIQELAIRYLRPPTPPAPGEIIISQLKNELTAPAPPLIIRQQPARPNTPEPLVVREAPPQAPSQVGRKVITISGKRIPPPPRKVIVERLAQLPSKPQSVLIERWLPYAQVKRRVIFNKPTQPDPVVIKPRNVIVQWEAPNVNVKKEIKYLGVIRANPAEYVQRYSTALLNSQNLPGFVMDIKTPDGLVLAADSKYNSLLELYGDVDALRLINLEAEGLGEYRAYLEGKGLNFRTRSKVESVKSFKGPSASRVEIFQKEAQMRADLLALVEKLFKSIDTNNSGLISYAAATNAILNLNNRLGRNYSENDVRVFFDDLDADKNGSIDFEEFKKAFINF